MLVRLTLRSAQSTDAKECARICHDAFAAIASRHGFPPDFPSVDVTRGYLSGMIEHPGFYAVVAERDGRIVGSNFLDERSPIVGLGPITVAPDLQDRQIGRALMKDVLERSVHQHALGVRLLQAAYHNRSMSLNAKLGFDVREPFAVMQGEPLDHRIPGHDVRTANDADFDECDALCRRVHGYDRGGELRRPLVPGLATVVERQGRITGYATGVAYFGHAVAETNDDLVALIGAAENFIGPGFLVPMRNTDLLRWCLDRHLRVVYMMNLMTIGLYQEPRGAFLASVLY